jgi:glycosyltransferase involved in cell wall biosynthesis
MNFYIQIKAKKRETAGFKAPEDVNSICQSMGMQPLAFPKFPTEYSKLRKRLWLYTVVPAHWLKVFFRVRKDDVVFFQHPMYANRLITPMVNFIRKWKKCRFVALIHDLESLRKGIGGVVGYKQEREEYSDTVMLDSFDKIICHNDAMRQYMLQQGFDENKLLTLKIFDYLCDDNGRKPVLEQPAKIAVAGNLAPTKSGYVYDMDVSGMGLNLYGINFDEQAFAGKEHVSYKGSFHPDELPANLEGSFGLVWDGPVGSTCAGNTGEYLRYNNPHKTSLYLACNLPVIIWSEAALAGFITRNGLGIAVKSLNEIAEAVAGLSPEDYQTMAANARAMGEKIRGGYFFRSAAEEAINDLKR